MVWGFSLLGNTWAFSVFCGGEDPGAGETPLPQTVQHFNKDLLSSPPTFVFITCLCLTAGSRTLFLFGDNRVSN